MWAAHWQKRCSCYFSFQKYSQNMFFQHFLTFRVLFQNTAMQCTKLQIIAHTYREIVGLESYPPIWCSIRVCFHHKRGFPSEPRVGAIRHSGSWSKNLGNLLHMKLCGQTCVKIPKRSEILDPWDPGSRMFQDLGSYIFIFSWDLKDLEFCHGNIAV